MKIRKKRCLIKFNKLAHISEVSLKKWGMSRKNRTPDRRTTRAFTHVNHTTDNILHNPVYYSEFGRRSSSCVDKFLLFYRRCIIALAMFAISDPPKWQVMTVFKRFTAMNLSPPTLVTSDMQYYLKEYSKWSTKSCKGKEYGKYVCLPPVLTFSNTAFGSQSKWQIVFVKEMQQFLGWRNIPCKHNSNRFQELCKVTLFLCTIWKHMAGVEIQLRQF